MQKTDLQNSSSKTIAAALCGRLEQIRLSRNISQAALAREAGVSRSTMTRIADGQSISLDSFIRVMQALGLTDHLETMLPDPSLRPVEQVRVGGKQRQRASGKRRSVNQWSWGEEGGQDASSEVRDS